MNDEILNDLKQIFRGEFASVLDEVSAIRSDLSTVHAEIAGVKGEITGLKTEVADIKESVATLAHNVNARFNAQDAKLDEIMNTVGVDLANHERRITRLEKRAA